MIDFHVDRRITERWRWGTLSARRMRHVTLRRPRRRRLTLRRPRHRKPPCSPLQPKRPTRGTPGLQLIILSSQAIQLCTRLRYARPAAARPVPTICSWCVVMMRCAASTSSPSPDRLSQSVSNNSKLTPKATGQLLGNRIYETKIANRIVIVYKRNKNKVRIRTHRIGSDASDGFRPNGIHRVSTARLIPCLVHRSVEPFE